MKKIIITSIIIFNNTPISLAEKNTIQSICNKSDNYSQCLNAYKNLPKINLDNSSEINSPIALEVIPYMVNVDSIENKPNDNCHNKNCLTKTFKRKQNKNWRHKPRKYVNTDDPWAYDLNDY